MRGYSSVAKAPYYPLPIVLAGLAGYFSFVRFKSNYRFWVWIIPALVSRHQDSPVETLQCL